MELVLENPSLLKKSMEIISDIVQEGTFVFKQDYIELVALNSNNVAMVIFRLLSTNFKTYELDEEDKQVSISLDHLSSVLKSCDDKAELSLTFANNGRLKLKSMGKNPKEFEVALIDYVNEELQKVPSLNFPVKVVMASSQLSQAVNDLGFLEEGVTFKAQDKSFSLSGRTTAMAGTVDFKENVDVKVEDELEKYECRYSMEYLKKFIKADKMVPSVELSFNKDYPLKVEYKVMDRLLLGFILAPRGEE